MDNWKYFSRTEIFGLDKILVSMLEYARGLAGFPIILTNTVRTLEKNAQVGGAQNSSHLKGLAVDVQKPIGDFETMKLMWALGRAGFKRVFVYTKHIHADIDPDKVQDICLWMGDSH